MKRFIRIILSVIFVLLILGVILFYGGGLKWLVEKRIIKPKKQEYVRSTHVLTDPITDIYIHTNSSSVQVLKSHDNKIRVECDDTDKAVHTISVEGTTLTIEIDDKRQWYDIADVIMDSAEITLYLPESEYKQLKVSTDSGNLEIGSGFKFYEVYLTTVTGSISLSSTVDYEGMVESTSGNITIKDTHIELLSCYNQGGNAHISGCTGHINVYPKTGNVKIEKSRLTAIFVNSESGKIDIIENKGGELIGIYSQTGDVTIKDSDANDTDIETKSADVTCSFKTAKMFEITTVSGNIDVPQSKEGDSCKITTVSGNVKITIE